MIRQFKQQVLICVANIGKPLFWHAVTEQDVVGYRSKQIRFLGQRLRFFHIGRHADLLHRLANFNQLRRAGLRVCLQLSTLCPTISLVVMIHIAEQQAGFCPVDDDAQIAIDAYRPELLVLCPVKFVKTHAWIGRIHLEIESRGLDGFLLFACEFGEAVGEGISDAELH